MQQSRKELLGACGEMVKAVKENPHVFNHIRYSEPSVVIPIKHNYERVGFWGSMYIVAVGMMKIMLAWIAH